MNGMNWKRVLIGGLAAGAVMIVGDIVLFGFAFPTLWEGALKHLGLDMSGGQELVTFGIEFVFGLLLAFIYAAIRPRFGAGWRTALIAGAVLWLATVLVYAGLVTFDILQWAFVGQLAAISAVIALLGATTAGYLYRES